MSHPRRIIHTARSKTLVIELPHGTVIIATEPNGETRVDVTADGLRGDTLGGERGAAWRLNENASVLPLLHPHDSANGIQLFIKQETVAATQARQARSNKAVRRG